MRESGADEGANPARLKSSREGIKSVVEGAKSVTPKYERRRRFQLLQLQLYRLRQRRQCGFFIVQGFFGIVDTLDVSPQVAGESDMSTGLPNLGIVGSGEARILAKLL